MCSHLMSLSNSIISSYYLFTTGIFFTSATDKTNKINPVICMCVKHVMEVHRSPSCGLHVLCYTWNIQKQWKNGNGSTTQNTEYTTEYRIATKWLLNYSYEVHKFKYIICKNWQKPQKIQIITHDIRLIGYPVSQEDLQFRDTEALKMFSKYSLLL